jgi:galactosyl transferase GMA12/MNN10 family
MVVIHSRSNSPCRSSPKGRNVIASAFAVFFGSLFLLTYFSHRLIARQQNNTVLVKAPINEIERECHKPTYPVVGDGNAGKICITTLTDGRKADLWQRMVRWREFDEVLRMTWPNKLNYCMKHNYQLYDESESSLDTSRAPAWSKIPAARRLLTEEGCDWVFWLDADTVIMNSEKRIEDFLPTAESGIDFVVTHQKGKSWNAGAWLIRNSDWSLKFLDDWWDMSEYSLAKGQADAGDNTAMKMLLKNMTKIDYDEKVAAPPRCQFNSVAKFFTPGEAARMTLQALRKNKQLFLSEETYHRGDFIAHAAGINNKVATAEMLLMDAH